MPAYDSRNLDQWAQNYLRAFLARLNCSDMPITLVLRDRTLPKRDSDKELISPSYQDYSDRYYTDQYGRPVLYAEPSKLSRSGYLARRLTIAVSNQIQLSSHTPLSELNEHDKRHLSYLTAVFLGLSLVLTPNSRAQKSDGALEVTPGDNFSRPDETQILYATAIYWRLKGQTFEHAMSLYSEQYNEKAREILRQAFIQLSEFNAEIEDLRKCLIETCQEKGVA